LPALWVRRDRIATRTTVAIRPLAHPAGVRGSQSTRR
jgi:hypothetical protein